MAWLPLCPELVPKPQRNVLVDYLELLFYKGIKCFLWNRGLHSQICTGVKTPWGTK